VPEVPSSSRHSPYKRCELSIVEVSRPSSTASLRELWEIVARRRAMILLIEGGLLLVCLLYCLATPNQYEASARVEMRTAPGSSLNLDSADSSASASMLSAPTELETIADIFRSEKFGVESHQRAEALRRAGFRGDFPSRFPGFPQCSSGRRRCRPRGAGLAVGEIREATARTGSAPDAV